MNKKSMLSLLLALVMIFGIVPTVSAASFSDVSGHWAIRYIDWASEKGYVNGYPDGRFIPDGNMTRAEFVKILNRYAGAVEKANVTFDDVNSNDWYYDEVRIAVKHGYLSDGGKFRGNDQIIRDDVIRMLAYVHKLRGDSNIADKFTDGNAVVSRDAVGALVERGVLHGYPDGSLRPLNAITRAEVAKLLYTARDILGVPKLVKTETPVAGGTWWPWPYYPPTPQPEPKPEPKPPVDTCPTDAQLRRTFALAVGNALNEIEVNEEVATKEYNATRRRATVTIINKEAMLNSIGGTGAMTQLKKLVDEKGLVSYQIDGQELRTLTGVTEQQMKEWIVEDFGAAAGVGNDLTLGAFIGKTITAKVKFASSQAGCPDIEDNYSVEFVGEACPAEEPQKEAFAAAVGTALDGIEIDDAVATKAYDAATRKATVTVVDRTAIVGQIGGTGAMVELKKLVDEKGLISYQIDGQELRTLTGVTEQQMKEWIVEDFGAAAGVGNDLTLGALIGKTLTATVKFKSTRPDCPRVASDTYSVEFVGEACPAEEPQKEAFAAAVGTALDGIEIDDAVATKAYDAATRKATVTVVDRTAIVGQIGATGAMVELKKLVDEKGLISYQIDGQELRTLTGASMQDMKEWIVQDFGAAAEVGTDLTLGAFIGKTISAKVTFAASQDNCPDIEDEYSVEFVCPAVEPQKDAFAEAVGTALDTIEIDEAVATKAYDATARKATVTVVDGTATASQIGGTGAMVELKKLVDEKGLISYQIDGQELRTLTGASMQDMKEWIVQDFGAAAEVGTDLTLGAFIGKTISAKVTFAASQDNCPDIEDEYSIEFVEEDLVCPDPEDVKAQFMNAVGTAMENLNIPENIAEVEYSEKAMTVKIVDPNAGAGSLSGTGIVTQIMNLVENNNFVSFKIGSQDEVVLAGMSATDIKGAIVEAVGAELNLQGDLTLGDLIDKQLTAVVKIGTGVEGCEDVTDTYTASFVDGVPQPTVTARIVKKDSLVGTTNYIIELTNAVYSDITQIKVGDRIIPAEDIEPIEDNDNQVTFNDGTTNPTIEITVKGQVVVITQP